jgi:hypothetical protein
MDLSIESGSIVIAIISMIILGFGFWVIKKIGEL